MILVSLIYPLTYGRLVPDVLKEDVEGLEELDADVTAALLVHDLQEEREHVALKEEAEMRKENRRFLYSWKCRNNEM